MKKLFIPLFIALYLLIHGSVLFAGDEVKTDYTVYYIPWIVNNSPNWWGSMNIKNQSSVEQSVLITYEDINGIILSKETLKIPSRGNNTWAIKDPKTRSIMIEGNSNIFVTAFMGNGTLGSGGFTELNVREITNLKN